MEAGAEEMYQPHWFRVWLFRHDLEVTAFNYQLDPGLPEIQDISAVADAIVRSGDVKYVLAKLNPSPRKGVRLPPEVDHLHVDFGRAWNGLKAWNIALWHVPYLRNQIRSFAIDQYGLHVVSDNERVLVTFTAASVDTLEGRLYAREIIEHLTGDHIKGFDVRALSHTERITLSIFKDEWRITAAQGTRRV